MTCKFFFVLLKSLDMLPHIISMVMSKEILVSRVILVFARNGTVPIHTVVFLGH